jgi:hypothetical protein
MKIYLDMCSLQRPLDDQSQLRVRLEAQAIAGVLALCESGGIDLIDSDALIFETDANPDSVRRDFAREALAKAAHFVKTSNAVQVRAQGFIAYGIKPLDALHLASAVEAHADYFCTCDDRFLKKARTLNTAPTKVVAPLELLTELHI